MSREVLTINYDEQELRQAVQLAVTNGVRTLTVGVGVLPLSVRQSIEEAGMNVIEQPEPAQPAPLDKLVINDQPATKPASYLLHSSGCHPSKRKEKTVSHIPIEDRCDCVLSIRNATECRYCKARRLAFETGQMTVEEDSQDTPIRKSLNQRDPVRGV